MRAHSRTTDAVTASLLLAAAAAVFAWAVGGVDLLGEPDRPDGRLAELAGRAECRPTMVAEEKQYRVASCESGSRRIVLATFATERGQRDWVGDTILEGSYLDGDLWIAYGEPSVLPGLQQRLGGTVRFIDRPIS
ncbi:hypothetical protein ACFU5O_29380 [Streptomyces sp. NPDC057445]|uniref:hypothetical protein n=1 Tax=Streptomyces sp. NPDC057445 TaxID=3346136 RepID=UPI0036AF16B3